MVYVLSVIDKMRQIEQDVRDLEEIREATGPSRSLRVVERELVYKFWDMRKDVLDVLTDFR